jgi:hypothetical protein
MMNLHFEKAGLVGSIITVLCCIGFGPLLAALSAIGAGFLVNDKVLAPLLIAFLLLGLTGLILSFRMHHRWPALLLHLTSGVAVFVFTFVVYHRLIIWLGLLGLVAAAAWDFLLRRSLAAHRSLHG